MNEKTKKRLKSAGAITLAAALLLTGTLAWSYVSSPVTNEAYGTVNPGGRLHDDFDGKDKDIYVENFGEQNIYARVKLTEYMEIGKNANKDRQTELDGNTRTDVTPVVTGSKLTDKSTWTAYFKDEDKAKRALLDGYFTLDTSGGKTVYMPTFNKNKDSYTSDVNGRYENEIGGSFSYTGYLDGTHYTDHKDYAVGDTAEGFEIVDADDNTTDEINSEKTVYDAIHATDVDALKALISTQLDAQNVKINETIVDETDPNNPITTYEQVTHEAKETVEASALITMKDYIAMSEADRKAYVGWVADGADGWAYWSRAIEPSTATGLLITSIGDPKKDVGDEWYFVIDVDAQFITVSDKFNVGTNGEDEPSDEAEELLKDLGLEKYKSSTGGDGSDSGGSSGDGSDSGGSSGGGTSGGGSSGGGTSGGGSSGGGSSGGGSSGGGTSGGGTSGGGTSGGGSYSSKAAAVVSLIKSAADSAIGTATVTIDGIEYIIVARDNNKHSAILLQKAVDKKSAFGSSTEWSNSIIRTYLNDTKEGGYLNGKTTLQELIRDGVTVKTASGENSFYRGDGSTYKETTDKVFLLSEADVFGTANGSATSEPNEYTNGTGKLNIDSSVLNTGSPWWLRSPRNYVDCTAYVRADGTVGNYNHDYIDNYIRPAVVVNL